MLQKLHSAKVAYFEMIAIWKMFQNSCLLWKTGKEFKSRTKLGEIGYIVEIVYNIFCRTLFSSFFLSANDMMVTYFLRKVAARRILWEKTQASGFRGRLEQPSFKGNVVFVLGLYCLIKISNRSVSSCITDTISSCSTKAIAVISYTRQNAHIWDLCY